MRAATEDLALLQTREGGKPLADSRGGVEAGVAGIDQFAELGPLHRARALQGSRGATDSMIRRRVLDELVGRAKALRVGPGADASTEMGP